MYSKTRAAIVSSLGVVAVAMIFATGPLVANHAFAYGSHHSYHHHSHHHHYYHKYHH
jgi:hypothetical protein